MSGHKFGVGITGLGKGIPKKRVTTEALAKRLRVNPKVILERTGIQSRFFVDGEETASGISVKAAKQALERSGIQADSINLVIGCTSSGDYIFPATACKIQNLLGAHRAGAFDLSASAAGFPIALGLARDRLACDPSAEHVLVFGTAVQSPYLNWSDPKISPLLGDGAGAAVLSRIPKGYGILACDTQSKGEAYEAARLKGGRFKIEMDGVTMGKEFLKGQPEIINRVLKKAGVSLNKVDLFIFHQANLRLIHFLMDRMKLSRSKTFTNVEHMGNTADASIPLALCEAVEQKRIKRGDWVVLSALGAGCLLSATALRWY